MVYWTPYTYYCESPLIGIFSTPPPNLTMEYQTPSVLGSESRKTVMECRPPPSVYWASYLWFIELPYPCNFLLSTHRKPNPLNPWLKFRAKKILQWNTDPLSWYIEPFTYSIMNPTHAILNPSPTHGISNSLIY
jgi:hypothetical protein